MKIISVVGARPNFMKVAPLHRSFSKDPSIESIIVHTGQHYDEKMSDVFFRQLELPKPDYYLGIGSGSHAESTAKIMIAFEEVILKEKPDLLLVVGDVNSTLACALVANKLHIKVAHVETGLRSRDRKMPEEINRILTDNLSDMLFISEKSGLENLKKEGISDQKVHFVGNVMIDSVQHYIDQIKETKIHENYKLKKKEYIVVTLHRPSNVDNEDSLRKLIDILEKCAERKKIIFPMHPRTENNLKKFGLFSEVESIPNLIIQPPLGYIEFLSLVNHSAAVVTDSGGIQEETTYLGIPCVTLRSTTERPSTIEQGTNILVEKLDTTAVLLALDQSLNQPKDHSIPKFWDGETANRITQILLDQKISG